MINNFAIFFGCFFAFHVIVMQEERVILLFKKYVVFQETFFKESIILI